MAEKSRPSSHKNLPEVAMPNHVVVVVVVVVVDAVLVVANVITAVVNYLKIVY
jgi:hypothetical protein